MTYRFSYISTHNDLIDAFDAERSLVSGLSAWSRGALLLLGTMWVVGFLVLGPRAAKDSPMLPLVWLGVGVAIFWKVAFKPYLQKRRIKQANDSEQPIEISFAENEVSASAPDGRSFVRKWSEFIGVETAKRGVLLAVADGTRNWIPNRAFRDKEEKMAFAQFVVEKLRKTEGTDKSASCDAS